MPREVSAETRRKLSEALKGNTNRKKGKPYTLTPEGLVALQEARRLDWARRRAKEKKEQE